MAGMPSGMQFMLKSLGLDPAQITQSVQEFGKVVLAMKEQLDRIEQKHDILMAQLYKPGAENELSGSNGTGQGTGTGSPIPGSGHGG